MPRLPARLAASGRQGPGRRTQAIWLAARRMARSVVEFAQSLMDLPMNNPPSGSPSLTVTSPDVATSLAGGHLSRTNCAGLRPYIEPGIRMSVKRIWISGRLRGDCSTTWKPAFSDHFHRADPEQQLIVHDENDRPPDC